MVKLTDYFEEHELEWKPQSTGIRNGKPWAMVLCYVSARAIQKRLDDVYGVLDWKVAYRFEPHGTVAMLSVYDKDKKEWVTKEDGAQETDIESFKGGISSALKRVASSGFGIGRYLYTLDTVFAQCSLTGKDGWKYAKTKDKTPFYWKVPDLPQDLLPTKHGKEKDKPEVIGNVLKDEEELQLTMEFSRLITSKVYDYEKLLEYFSVSKIAEIQDNPAKLKEAVEQLRTKPDKNKDPLETLKEKVIADKGAALFK